MSSEEIRMLIFRRIRKMQTWFGALQLSVQLLLLVCLLTSPCALALAGIMIRKAYIQTFVLTPEDREHHRSGQEGTPNAARRLIREMEPYNDPDAAVADHPNWFAHRFNNGEWIFGHGIDSHGLTYAGGTFVCKDSRSRTRVFFGHVCGENADFPWCLRDCNTLDEFESKSGSIPIMREWQP